MQALASLRRLISWAVIAAFVGNGLLFFNHTEHLLARWPAMANWPPVHNWALVNGWSGVTWGLREFVLVALLLVTWRWLNPKQQVGQLGGSASRYESPHTVGSQFAFSLFLIDLALASVAVVILGPPIVVVVWFLLLLLFVLSVVAARSPGSGSRW